MIEPGFRQKAGITKRANTRDVFLGTATGAFSELAYPDITVEDIARRSGKSVPTFYNFFTAKSAWGAAVLDQHLNDALDQQTAIEAETVRTPHAHLLGHFGLLAQVSAPLPGITQALSDEHNGTQRPYSALVPRYYGEVTQALQGGQEQHVFRHDMSVGEMADVAICGLAAAYAIHLGDPMARTILNGFMARE